MLKSTLNLKEKIYIGKYLEVSSFLKQKSKGYTAKKSKVFSPEEIQKFMTTASDKFTSLYPPDFLILFNWSYYHTHYPLGTKPFNNSYLIFMLIFVPLE